MFQRLSTGWDLVKCSWRVLKFDKELIAFPILSGVACLFVLASFMLPQSGREAFDILGDEGTLPREPFAYVILFLFYFATYFVIIFFNSALISCAVIRFEGRDPRVSDGLKAAWDRLPQIIGWALVSATVGVILKLIESRAAVAGKIFAALGGAAWSIGTYFVVPVLVVEGLGPFQAMKRSADILRKALGEALSANFSIAFVVMAAMIAATVPVFLGIATGIDAVAIASMLIMYVLWVLIVIIAAALNTITLGALYVYAAEDRVPEIFDRDALARAFGKTAG